MNARQRSGRGEPLVLLHGVGLDHTLWDDLAPLLEPDFEVLRYDLLGHGAAPALRGPAAIGDFIAQLDDELERAGWRGAHLLGYSMGGLIAGAYAAARPRRVRRLALLSTVFRRTADEAAAVQARLAAAATQDPQAAARISLARWFTPDFQARRPERVRASASACWTTTAQASWRPTRCSRMATRSWRKPRRASPALPWS